MLDVKLKVKIASELRDSVEIFQSVEYARFLSILMPVFTDILMNGQPVFASNAPEQVSHRRGAFFSYESAWKYTMTRVPDMTTNDALSDV